MISLLWFLGSIKAQDWNLVGQPILGSASGNKAGNCIDINGDGTVMAVGEPLHDSGGILSGRVSVYTLQSGTWVLKGSVLLSPTHEDMFGNAVSLSDDGNILAVGVKMNDENGENAGKVCIYHYDGADWVEYGNVLKGANAGDVFGAAVMLNDTGDRVAISSIGDDTNGDSAGKVQVYLYSSGAWSALGTPMLGIGAYNGLGSGLSISGDGNTVIASAGYASYDEISKGFICVFRYDGSVWQQISPITWGDNMGDLFGNAVSISSDGNTIIVGAPMCNGSMGVDAGAVKVIDYDGSNWQQRGTTFLGNTEGGQRGKAVTISNDGNLVAIGEPNNTTNGFMSGKVTVFSWDGANWVQRGISIDGTSAFDCAGSKILISSNGSNLMLGIPGDDGGGNDAGKIAVYKYY